MQSESLEFDTESVDFCRQMTLPTTRKVRTWWQPLLVAAAIAFALPAVAEDPAPVPIPHIAPVKPESRRPTPGWICRARILLSPIQVRPTRASTI